MSACKRLDNRRWDLTEERMAHLNACAAQGKSLHGAANELNVRAYTIKNAARREGKTEWLREKFPKAFQPHRAEARIKDFDGPRTRTIQEIGGWPEVPNNAVTRWMVRSWR